MKKVFSNSKCVLTFTHNLLAGTLNVHIFHSYELPPISLVVREVKWHHTGIGSIPAGGPIVDEFFPTVPVLNLRHIPQLDSIPQFPRELKD